ncbi:uncharacterized protein LOC9313071 [Arabidopsis lyrata subsp. lyrata]|uniref:uncharacterized protein LOC9313071 n=1 Tax=Arabidopsis lyrata subsp. lyrata TaxID=81972 RepID=UPI000A29A5E6|nr:uncharacterized protein LOC9313071 [Arabidopsis lyrata subsp. lyrata]|eukprot:XP_020881197.1 uncharacterized protein LOC9313071 [Arabidopsis lyrata subsp. lyrata]
MVTTCLHYDYTKSDKDCKEKGDINFDMLQDRYKSSRRIWSPIYPFCIYIVFIVVMIVGHLRGSSQYASGVMVQALVVVVMVYALKRDVRVTEDVHKIQMNCIKLVYWVRL